MGERERDSDGKGEKESGGDRVGERGRWSERENEGQEREIEKEREI